ncbi:MAG: copper resistance system multicopper oxidase [Deltaproteobacteria bacterium]|nr:copper resistance system multicopper oxidase [Deltaproteobacteria bacterium]
MIRKRTIDIAGKDATATTINGSVPGPLVRLREGQTAVIRVTNRLEEDTSIHWHGIILPADMDGVPGVSFPGIKPGETFTYRFPVIQSGTYWYHSHTGMQEQLGHYGPLIIDPAEPEPFAYDRDYVVVLSDWTFEDPHKVLAKLKKKGGYYNFQKRTVGDFFRDVGEGGWRAAVSDRLMWGRMRMDPTDIADVTGYTYTYLLNGLPPGANWTGLFRPGERVRLRFINAGAASYFDVRVPGLEMTVIQTDGQNVEPVTVDEFRIAIAETYDVIVEPKEDRAYTIFAEAMDRSGYACGTLASREGMSAPIPSPRPRPLRTMADMGMASVTGEHGMEGMHGSSGMSMGGSAAHAGMPGMDKADHAMAPEPARQRSVMHGPDHHGPGNSMVAMMPRSHLDEPGAGLEDAGRRVLVYGDLRSLTPGGDRREPEREIELHLTGNMERYIWGFDGKKYSEVKDHPIPFRFGERLRLTLVNDTMMDHPIHLHGMWMELDNGAGAHKPLKHTINVKPGERLSVEITADALGQWAFHCHILYHMDAGMFRVVSVSQSGREMKG